MKAKRKEKGWVTVSYRYISVAASTGMPPTNSLTICETPFYSIGGSCPSQKFNSQ